MARDFGDEQVFQLLLEPTPEDLKLALACELGDEALRGYNWARWAALAWIAFHVILSAFHAFGEFAIHCLFCAVIAWVLFRPEAARHFRDVRVEPHK
jgi:hypothetical protein